MDGLTAPAHKSDRIIRPLFILALVYQVAMALAWVGLDRLPPYWDEAVYLYNGAAQLDALRSGGLSAWYTAWLDLDRTRPLLVSTLTVPFYALFGVSADAGLLVNIVALIALSLSVYALGAAMGGRRAGIVAALLVGSYPVLIGLSHILLSELTMTALVAATLLALWRSDGFAHTGWSLLAGCLTGLGMLTKVFFAPFVAGPWLMSMWLACRRQSAERPRFAPCWGRAALAGLVALAIASTWYAPNLHTLIERSFDAAVGREAAPYGPATPWHWYALLRYLGMFLSEGMSFAGAIALAAGVIGLALPHLEATRPTFKRCALVFLLSSILPAYALFTSLTNQDLKHVTGILPALAVLSGWGIAQLTGRCWGWALGVVSLVMLAQVTLGTLPGKLQAWRPETRLYGAIGIKWVYPAQPWIVNTRYAAPETSEWPLYDILAYASQVADSEAPSRSRVRIAAINEYACTDHSALLFEIRRSEMPLDIAWLEMSNLEWPDVLIYRPGNDPALARREDTVRAIIAVIEQPGSGFERAPRTFDLPDGGQAIIYVRRAASCNDDTFGSNIRCVGAP